MEKISIHTEIIKKETLVTVKELEKILFASAYNSSLKIHQQKAKSYFNDTIRLHHKTLFPGAKGHRVICNGYGEIKIIETEEGLQISGKKLFNKMKHLNLFK